MAEKAEQDRPAQTPAQKLAAEYDHSAVSGFDPEEFPSLASTPSTPPVAVSPPEASRTPPKDPATGRFVSQTTTPPVHSPRLVRMAREFGIPETEIEGLAPEALEATVEILSLRVLKEHRDQSQWRSQEPPPPATPPEPEFSIPGLKEEDYDAAFITPFKKVIGDLTKQVKDLQNQVMNQTQARQAETHTQRVDRAIEALNDGERLGHGSVADMEPSSPAVLKRHALWNAARILAGPKATDAQVIAKIPDAHKSVFGASTSPPEPRNGKPRYTQDQWEQSGLARPASRANTKEPKGREAAIRAVAQKQREMLAESYEDELRGGDEEQTLLP